MPAGFLCYFLLAAAPVWAQNTITIPVNLTGKVVLEDGSDLPSPARIVLTCRDRVITPATIGTGELAPLATPETEGNYMREETLTSASGVFGFDFKVSRQVDARFQYALQQVDLTGCEITVSLEGFQPIAVRLGIRRRGDDPDLGEVVLRRQGARREGRPVSVTSLQAPEDAREAFRQARRELRRETPDYGQVAADLEEAVTIYPEYARAWQMLGEIRLFLDNESGASQAFEQAIEADPQYVEPYLSLAGQELLKNNWMRVADLSRSALALNPTRARAHYFLAVAAFALRDFDRAKKSAVSVQQSEEADRYPMTHYVLGAICAMSEDYSEAASEFREYLQLEPDSRKAREVRQVLATWERSGLLN